MFACVNDKFNNELFRILFTHDMMENIDNSI